MYMLLIFQKELEEIIHDAVKKKKYQKQVTIFIVGYENVCGQKLRLLQQVNEVRLYGIGGTLGALWKTYWEDIMDRL